MNQGRNQAVQKLYTLIHISGGGPSPTLPGQTTTGPQDAMLPAMASTHSTRTLQRRSSFGTQGQVAAHAQPTAGAGEQSRALE